METAVDLAFMCLGFGFFLFVIKMILSENDKEYSRKLNEQREFGYQAISKPDQKPQKEPKHKN